MNIILLGLTVFLIMCCFIYVKWQHDKQFGKWFGNVLHQAPFYGFTQERIDEFEEIYFWNYFLENKTPEEALKQYLADH